MVVMWSLWVAVTIIWQAFTRVAVATLANVNLRLTGQTIDCEWFTVAVKRVATSTSGCLSLSYRHVSVSRGNGDLVSTLKHTMIRVRS